jgi:transcriptional regulator with XRE-family HTH domain
MPNDSGRPVDAVAANLRRLRIAARLSLSELARATGVGKATLSAIENGQGNPTVETLAALAEHLGVPLVELFEAPALEPVTVVRAGAGEPVADGMERLGRLTRGELVRLELGAEELVEARPRQPGTRMHLIVTRGKLVSGPAERITELSPGDYASFPGDVPHVFRTARRAASAVVAVETP